MIWLLTALSAYFGFAVVAIIDKYLLVGRLKSPLYYAASIGLLSGLTFLVLPFDPFLPNFQEFIIDAVAGAFFVLALVVYFTALKGSETTRVVPLASAFVPLFTVLLAYLGGQEALSSNQIIGFTLLVLGGTLITLKSTKNKPATKTLVLTLLASLLFAAHFSLIKSVYTNQPFIGGAVWASTGKIFVGLVIFAVLGIRGELRGHYKNTRHKKSLSLFISGRVIGGASGLAQNYAISLASVSLITALQGFQYAFLFVLIYLLGKHEKKLSENFSRRVMLQKIAAIILLSTGLIFIASQKKTQEPIELGVTFSQTYATYGLGLDWRETYQAILADLPISWLRIPVYWPSVEPEKDDWNLEDIEYQVNRASEKNIKIILNIGRKLPRWPECHIPGWVADLPAAEQEQRLLNYLSEIVGLYDDNQHVVAWQVENEPLFPFGLCPKPDYELLLKEIELVKSISRKPVIVSDSGELSSWLPEAEIGDILGTTMYRRVFHKRFGEIEYPLPPEFFKLKEVWAKVMSGKRNLQIMNVELQAEPWGSKPLNELAVTEQLALMNPERLLDNVGYARTAGFSPTLLWGAEWWYWLKVRHNNPTLWLTAQEIFDNAKIESKDN